MMHVLRVLLVDDHRLLREGVRQMLVDRIGAVVTEAGTGEEALQALAQGKPFDIAIIDLTLPDVPGLELVKQIRQQQPRLPILVLSMHPPEEFARSAFSVGALAYMTKDAALSELIEAIKQVRQGRPYIPQSVRKVLKALPPHASLSDREFQVMRLLAEGKTVSEAATDMGISVKTVSTYRARLLEKLGMKTNAEIMRYALRQRLVD